MNKVITNNRQELSNIINNAYNEIIDYVNNNNYLTITEHNSINKDHYQILKLTGKCDTCRLKRHLNKVLNRKNLYNLNRFFHFLNKINITDQKIVIKEPKHEIIQAFRKKWKDLKKQADEALKQYKEEKGKYYKEKFGI